MIRILVVDDDLELARLLAFGLRLHGYLVEVAANGRQALTLLMTRRFNAIVLDWNMPVMGGEEFLERYVRRASDAQRAPVVVMSADPAAERKAIQLGAAATLAKPFYLAELHQVVATVVQMD